MSKSAMLEEDSSWAQTFVTVTPQDDGFLREIEDNSVISGNADVPLNLDTWNIVLRRSLVNSTRDLTNTRELGKIQRVAIECQTYLQGVPRVELPLVYRNEATQTLYIGKDKPGTLVRPFDDIITVMNEKPLPEWKKSQRIQTKILIESETRMKDAVRKFQATDIADEDVEKFDSMAEAEMESSDLLNFLIDRTLWMCEPIKMPELETQDAAVETLLRYNHGTGKLIIDREVQTGLSCEPRYSNSMLVSEYNETRNFCRERVEEWAKRAIDSRIVAENVVDDIVGRAKAQIDFPLVLEEKIVEIRHRDRKATKVSLPDTFSPSVPLGTWKRDARRTRNTDSPPCAVKYHSAAVQDSYLEPECSWRRSINPLPDSSIGRPSSSFKSSSSRRKIRGKELPPRDEEALAVLRGIEDICQNKTSQKERIKSPRKMYNANENKHLVDLEPMLRSVQNERI